MILPELAKPCSHPKRTPVVRYKTAASRQSSCPAVYVQQAFFRLHILTGYNLRAALCSSHRAAPAPKGSCRVSTHQLKCLQVKFKLFFLWVSLLAFLTLSGTESSLVTNTNQNKCFLSFPPTFLAVSVSFAFHCISTAAPGCSAPGSSWMSLLWRNWIPLILFHLLSRRGWQMTNTVRGKSSMNITWAPHGLLRIILPLLC